MQHNKLRRAHETPQRLYKKSFGDVSNAPRVAEGESSDMGEAACRR